MLSLGGSELLDPTSVNDLLFGLGTDDELCVFIYILGLYSIEIIIDQIDNNLSLFDILIKYQL